MNQQTIGFGLCLLVYAFGHISGGHFNPSVTIAMFVNKHESCDNVKDLFIYIFCQCFGGIFGGLFCWGIGGGHLSAVYPTVDEHASQPQMNAFVAEYLFTFFLVSAVLHSSFNQRDNQFYGISYHTNIFCRITVYFIGLAIGSVLVAAVASIGNVSGAALNFAVWLGTILSATIAGTHDVTWKYLWLYFFAPICGSLSAAFIFKFLFVGCDEEECKIIPFDKRQILPKVRFWISEFIGTFFLVLVVKCSTGDQLAVGFALLSLVYQYGYLSGGHFNPAGI